MNRSFSLHTLVVLLVAGLLLSSCVAVQESLVTGRKRAFGYTWAQEVQMGTEADPQIVAQFGLYPDDKMSAYVDQMGQELLAVSHLRRPDTPAEMRNTPFTFRVLDSPVVNAFALPGGYVYVTRGLMAHLENEAQLAVVLGHEIGHVVGRHASKRAASQQFGQLAVIGGAILGQSVLGGTAGEDILNTAGTAAGLLFLRYGRDDERESDDLGVEYASLEGYKASEGSEFFRSLKRLSDNAGQGVPSFLSTHPDPGEREQEIIRMANEWSAQMPTNTVNSDEFLAVIDNVVIGDDPRQGYTEGGVFYHPELLFQFPVPNGYQVINQPSQVALVAPEQKAVVVFSIADKAETAEAAGNAFASQEGINVIDRGATRTNGLAAYNILASAVPQQGSEVKLIAHYVEYRGNVYSYLAYSATADFETYRPALESAVRGFKALTDRSKISVQPTRMRVVAAPRNGTFQSFLPDPLPNGLTAEELAIINQVELNENISRGRKLKLPR